MDPPSHPGEEGKKMYTEEEVKRIIEQATAAADQRAVQATAAEQRAVQATAAADQRVMEVEQEAKRNREEGTPVVSTLMRSGIFFSRRLKNDPPQEQPPQVDEEPPQQDEEEKVKLAPGNYEANSGTKKRVATEEVAANPSKKSSVSLSTKTSPKWLVLGPLDCIRWFQFTPMLNKANMVYFPDNRQKNALSIIMEGLISAYPAEFLRKGVDAGRFLGVDENLLSARVIVDFFTPLIVILGGERVSISFNVACRIHSNLFVGFPEVDKSAARQFKLFYIPDFIFRSTALELLVPGSSSASNGLVSHTASLEAQIDDLRAETVNVQKNEDPENRKTAQAFLESRPSILSLNSSVKDRDTSDDEASVAGSFVPRFETYLFKGTSVTIELKKSTTSLDGDYLKDIMSAEFTGEQHPVAQAVTYAVLQRHRYAIVFTGRFMIFIRIHYKKLEGKEEAYAAYERSRVAYLVQKKQTSSSAAASGTTSSSAAASGTTSSSAAQTSKHPYPPWIEIAEPIDFQNPGTWPQTTQNALGVEMANVKPEYMTPWEVMIRFILIASRNHVSNAGYPTFFKKIFKEKLEGSRGAGPLCNLLSRSVENESSNTPVGGGGSSTTRNPSNETSAVSQSGAASSSTTTTTTPEGMLRTTSWSLQGGGGGGGGGVSLGNRESSMNARRSSVVVGEENSVQEDEFSNNNNQARTTVRGGGGAGTLGRVLVSMKARSVSPSSFSKRIKENNHEQRRARSKPGNWDVGRRIFLPAATTTTTNAAWSESRANEPMTAIIVPEQAAAAHPSLVASSSLTQKSCGSSASAVSSPSSRDDRSFAQPYWEHLWDPVRFAIPATNPALEGSPDQLPGDPEELGWGRIGPVYRKSIQDRDAVFKVLSYMRKPLEDLDERRDELKHEAEIYQCKELIPLQGEFIAKFLWYGVIIDGWADALVTEYAGVSLDRYTKVTRSMAQGAKNALDQFHRVGIVHRDVAKRNFAYNDENRKVVLLDFGWAWRKADETWLEMEYAARNWTWEQLVNRDESDFLSAFGVDWDDEEEEGV